MKKAGVVSILMAVCLTGAWEAGAQEHRERDALDLPAGARVRIRTEDAANPVVGTLLGANSETVRLKIAGRAAEVPRESIVRMDLSRKRWNREGAVWGAVVGAAVGFSAGYAPCYDNDRGPRNRDGYGSCTSSDDKRAAAISVGGGLVGALIGASIDSHRWETVSPGAVRVRVGALAGGVGGTIAVRF